MEVFLFIGAFWINVHNELYLYILGIWLPGEAPDHTAGQRDGAAASGKGGITVKFPGRIARYLRGNVDFDSFFVLDIAVQDKENAVLLLAPRDITTDKFFCMQYHEHSYFYGSIENMKPV